MRRGRTPGLRTAKTVLAAVVSFAVAEALHTSGSPILAPLTALLVVQLTMYETLAQGRERIVSVVAGVLLAAVFASFVGLSWWSLGLIVLVSIVAGRLLRLGPNLLEVPISAMLVLAVGGAERAVLSRVEETLIGAAVGVLVNLLIAPPLYVQPASDAIAELAERMAQTTADLAAALRGSWSRGTAEAQLARTFFVPEDQSGAAYPPGARAALADVLDALAGTLREAAGVPSGATGAAAGTDVGGAVRELEQRRRALAERLVVDPLADPAAWAQHGSLLDAVDRLRVEIESALTPPDVAGVRDPLAELNDRTLGRALRAAREHRPRRRTQG